MIDPDFIPAEEIAATVREYLDMDEAIVSTTARGARVRIVFVTASLAQSAMIDLDDAIFETDYPINNIGQVDTRRRGRVVVIPPVPADSDGW